MNYIGIDPSADTFTAGMFHQGKRMGKPQTMPYTNEGIDTFLEQLEQKGCSRKGTLICVENTGVFSELLLYRIHQKGWMVTVAEAMAVHKAFKTDGAKTDAIDSLKVAEYAYRYHDKLTLWKPHEAIIEQIKVLLTTREQLVGQRTALKNTRYMLRRKYIQTPDANESVGTLIDQVNVQVDHIEKAISRLINSHPTLAQMVALITTAPGAGLLLAAHLLVITSGFQERISYRTLARHIGIAPLPHTSGKSVKRKPRARGYGPRMMRKLLHLAARSMVTHKVPFRRYYAEKLSQGKPKAVAINNVSNRLLRIICSMIKNKQPYKEGFVSVNPRLLST
jgi:transposase